MYIDKTMDKISMQDKKKLDSIEKIGVTIVKRTGRTERSVGINEFNRYYFEKKMWSLTGCFMILSWLLFGPV